MKKAITLLLLGAMLTLVGCIVVNVEKGTEKSMDSGSTNNVTTK
jgi:hypothetical protein